MASIRALHLLCLILRRSWSHTIDMRPKKKTNHNHCRCCHFALHWYTHVAMPLFLQIPSNMQSLTTTTLLPMWMQPRSISVDPGMKLGLNPDHDAHVKRGTTGTFPRSETDRGSYSTSASKRDLGRSIHLVSSTAFLKCCCDYEFNQWIMTVNPIKRIPSLGWTLLLISLRAEPRLWDGHFSV